MIDKNLLKQIEKDFDNENRQAHPGEIELCLCSRCASAFYAMSDHGIERVHKYQFENEPCSICNYQIGYDFYVWPLSRVKSIKSHI